MLALLHCVVSMYIKLLLCSVQSDMILPKTDLEWPDKTKKLGINYGIML